MRRFLISWLLFGCADQPAGDEQANEPSHNSDTGVEPIDCPEGTEAIDEECVDIDECAVDNGGCGDPELWVCENQYAAPPACIFDWSADRDALLQDVERQVFGGSLSSRLVVWGDASFPLTWTPSGEVIAAAARVGEGKVLHVGHEGQLGGALSGDGDAGQLLQNAVAWMSSEGTAVGVSRGMDAARTFLEDNGHEVVVVDPADLDDVAVWVTTTYDDHDAETDAAIRAWIEAGGGVISGGHAWWWASSTGGTDPYNDHPGNQWLGVAGMTLSGSVAGEAEVAVQSPAPVLLHAERALVAASHHIDETAPLSQDDQLAASDSAGFAASVLPIDSEWFERARDVLDGGPPVVPTSDTPIAPAEQPIEALMVRIASALTLRLSPEEITKHPGADDFPGVVPSGAERGSASVRVMASYAGRDRRYLYSGAGAAVWRSTGLYVPPGEVVTVTVPSDAVGTGVSLLVGAHTDRLWRKDEWFRFPEITRAFSVETEVTPIASAFGGALYVRVPSGASLGEVNIEVDGAVTMPRFVLGVDASADWQTPDPASAAPWAELESDGLILTVPTSAVTELEDPEALMEFWQEVMNAQAVLAAVVPERPRPERIVTDRQISAGWMHSGYPIMAHNASAGDLVDLAHLTSVGDWGAFHELGHNHQWADWLLPGTTEASCNLWSVYTMEEVVGLDRSLAHSALEAGAREARVASYVDGGRDFSASWSVWTALETWLQIQENFGWEPLIEVQRMYLDDDPSAAPADEQRRIDRWARRMSFATGHDLTAFFGAWGMPLSASVADAVSHLPPWEQHPMP